MSENRINGLLDLYIVYQSTQMSEYWPQIYLHQLGEMLKKKAEVLYNDFSFDTCEVVRHPYFERMSLAMIYVNAIWIAVDIEFNKADMVMQAEYPFLIAEIVFTLYFSGELFVRFMSYEKRKRALKDSWFIFDLLLVAMMLLETWVIPLTAFIVEGGFQPPADDGANISRSASVLRIARIMRVFRTARIIRVARYMPELMILIKGVLPDPSELFLKGGKTVLFINSNIC